jgi:hypothetical protein
MPVNRGEPRPSSARTNLRHKEKKLVLQELEETAMVAKMFQAYAMVQLRHSNHNRFRRLKKMARMWALVAMLTALSITEPRLRPHSDDFPAPKSHMQFSEEEFVFNFRFRRHDFMRVLELMGFTDEFGSPKQLEFGRPGHGNKPMSDWALMVVLKRLCSTGALEDVCRVVGGSRSYVSEVFIWMVDEIFRMYGHRVQDLHAWREWFPDFAAHYREAGSPYENMIGMIDGHFEIVMRPGGAACINENVCDRDLYSRNHKEHGLTYQVVAFPNGCLMFWGPWPGKRHDANVLRWSGILETMKDVKDILGETFYFYGDAAYPLNEFIQRAIKKPPGQQMNRPQRLLNAIMSRFRIVVENALGECCLFMLMSIAI